MEEKVRKYTRGRYIRNRWIDNVVDEINVWYNNRESNTLIYRFSSERCVNKIYQAIRALQKAKKVDWSIEMWTSPKHFLVGIKRLDKNGNEKIAERYFKLESDIEEKTASDILNGLTPSEKIIVEKYIEREISKGVAKFILKYEKGEI